MMKKFVTAAAAALLALTMCSTAFAAWEQDDSGNWRYMTGRDTWVTSGYTQDGYWVDVNGYWDGSPSIGIRQSDGTYKEYEDVNQGQAILGRRIFKSEGKAEVDDRNTMFTVTCTVYDTSFKTEDEIKGIKKGDIVEFPEIGLTTTAVNKAGQTVTRSASNKDATTATSSGSYRVRLEDAEGNQYMLTAARLRKISADNSATETILRPIASGVVIHVPTWRDALRINGTSHYTTTKNLVNGMFFEADLEGDTATQVRDVIYNYDTTNAPVYTEDAAHGHLYNVNEY